MRTEPKNIAKQLEEKKCFSKKTQTQLVLQLKVLMPVCLVVFSPMEVREGNDVVANESVASAEGKTVPWK